MIDVMEEIDVVEFSKREFAGESFVLLDVRESWERDIASIPRSTHIPMGEIPQRYGELPIDGHIVVMCHHGGRSAQVTGWLRQKGFHASNLQGGIDAWSARIDSSVPRY
jgi:rhodanese-related sulfurtransferase